MNSIIDNLENLPSQVKEQVVQIINQKAEQYFELSEDPSVIKSVRRCT